MSVRDTRTSEGSSGRSAGSLCTRPAGGPRSFHRYSAPAGSVRQEIVDTMYATGRPSVAVAGLIGDVLGRMRAAAAGELPEESEVLEPVRSAPELWELKWKLKRLGEFRMYHAEPGGSPALVALRFHRKDLSSGDSATIAAAQDDEIATASTRYAGGMALRWGHLGTCVECL